MHHPDPCARIHVPQGMDHIATGATTLTTFVGSDFVVGVCDADGGCRGGLTSFLLEPTNDGTPLEALLPRRVHTFLRTVRQACGSSRVLATVAGGANILGTVPARQWEVWVMALSEMICKAVRSYDLVTDTDVGGHAARFVTVDVGAASVHIDVLHGRDKPRATATPAPLWRAENGADWPVDMACALVQRSPHRLVAVLGSCVGIALFDPTTRIGGLAHVVLPECASDRTSPLRYVDTAVPALIGQLQREGADTTRLQAKLAGGAAALPGASCFHTGMQNVQAARACLDRAGIPILSEHVGGRTGRKIVVDLRSFRVSVQWLAGAS